MAKRKNQLADSLNKKGTSKPGWRDIISPGETSVPKIVTTPEPVAEAATEPKVKAPKKVKKAAPSYKRKTYLVAPAMIERIEAVADQERVGINQLVRYMLDMALTQIETGEHKIPTTAGRRDINW